MLKIDAFKAYIRQISSSLFKGDNDQIFSSEFSKDLIDIEIEFSDETPYRDFSDEADTSILDNEIERINNDIQRLRNELEGKRNKQGAENAIPILEKRIRDKEEEKCQKEKEREELVNAKIKILGVYMRETPKIVLYINNIKACGGNFDWLVVQTYAHELMHAYFDHDRTKPQNYTSFVEEPITELGMLYLMKKYDSQIPGIYADALQHVKNKQKYIGTMHYGFGAYLFGNELPPLYWIGIMYDAKYDVLDPSKLDVYKKTFAQGKYPNNEQQHADWLEELLDKQVKRKSISDCNTAISVYEDEGMPIPPNLIRRRIRCEEKEKRGVSSTAPYGGSWFTELTTTRMDTPSLIKTMEDTANALDRSVSSTEPVALLGQIQAGKTRAFLGVIAKCFDLGFESILIMTQSNVALAWQTEKRIFDAFSSHIGKELGVYNIIQNPNALRAWNANTQKNIIIAKKQKHNLNHTSKLLQPGGVLNGKKVLVIDDEADVIGLGFTIDSKGDVQKAILADLIDSLRGYAQSTCAYLEVTATPYALFLQSNANAISNNWQPLKPTQVFDMDLYSGYTGGTEFFVKNPSKYFKEVTHEEIITLTRQNSKNKSFRNPSVRNPFTSDQIEGFRNAFLSFLIAGAIRRCSEPDYRCAQLFNISTQQNKHERYSKFCGKILEELSKCDSKTWNTVLIPIFREFKVNGQLSWEQVSSQLKNDIKSDAVNIIIVNSNRETANIQSLLDQSTGQLELGTPYNVFIGGESIGRGITIDHLISFFYVRSNRHQDTSIQHMRIFGNRSKEDLNVTRFYTSIEIFSRLQQMYEADQNMRKQIAEGKSTIFLKKEAGVFVPCPPNKCLGSSYISIGPNQFLLPIGFDTKRGTVDGYNDVNKIISRLPLKSSYTESYPHYKLYDAPFSEVEKIFNIIKDSLTWSNPYSEYEWDIKSHLEAIKRNLRPHDNVIIYIPERQNDGGFSIRSRFTHDGVTPADAPHDGKSDNIICKRLATNCPVVMLLPQNPQISDGWSHNEHFYWPVITMPSSCEQYVFCND